MSRKKTKADEFAAMADVHKILVNFDSHARARIVASVEGKILAEAPKKRVRRRIDPLAVDSVQSRQAEASARKSAGIQ